MPTLFIIGSSNNTNLKVTDLRKQVSRGLTFAQQTISDMIVKMLALVSTFIVILNHDVLARLNHVLQFEIVTCNFGL